MTDEGKVPIPHTWVVADTNFRCANCGARYDSYARLSEDCPMSRPPAPPGWWRQLVVFLAPILRRVITWLIRRKGGGA